MRLPPRLREPRLTRDWPEIGISSASADGAERVLRGHGGWPEIDPILARWRS